ncbi:uncharacterized protein LOC120352620 isoform X8 [Nilaparvata lugens]|uniref:uncharacterized protein LOC120352620 isoform X8 n=1 Tax=Nilaparvata lugens TaxID=108931 RepID=UPI00193D8146|nr:uncharacterized protein LOC120352620 isoform X8 [Nilaparvata lugens]
MKLGLFIFPILVFSISVFAVGASPAADDESQMLAEMMEQLSQDKAPARHERSGGWGRRGGRGGGRLWRKNIQKWKRFRPWWLRG